MENNYDYTTHFSNYLKENKGKFVAVITPRQYAIEIDKHFSHEEMLSDLVSKIRPNMKMDEWGNALDSNEDYRNDTVTILGYPGYMQIEYPLRELITPQQYSYLRNILVAIREYNKHVDETTGTKYEILAFGFGFVDLEAQYYKDNIDELINKIAPFVENNYFIGDEVIIGEPLEENEKGVLADNIIKQKKNNTMDVEGNPILGPDSEYRIKGYSNIVILILITTVVSAVIFLLGMFIDLN